MAASNSTVVAAPHSKTQRHTRTHPAAAAWRGFAAACSMPPSMGRCCSFWQQQHHIEQAQQREGVTAQIGEAPKVADEMGHTSRCGRGAGATLEMCQGRCCCNGVVYMPRLRRSPADATMLWWPAAAAAAAGAQQESGAARWWGLQRCPLHQISVSKSAKLAGRMRKIMW